MAIRSKIRLRSHSKKSSPPGYDHDDPSLRTGDGGLTVWSLREMARERRFKQLNHLFDNGLTMNALPVGVAAGTGALVLDIDVTDIIADCVNWLVAKNWCGKIFYSSNNRAISEGRNRIRKSFVNLRSPIAPIAKFKTMLLDSHPLVPKAKSNFVILNYADPLTKPYVVEYVAAHAYDVMVAVKGRYGPVFVGKTWLGTYNEKGEFTAWNPNKLIAWYFLDFNKAAVKEQQEHHWDGSKEKLPRPIPHLKN